MMTKVTQLIPHLHFLYSSGTPDRTRRHRTDHLQPGLLDAQQQPRKSFVGECGFRRDNGFHWQSHDQSRRLTWTHAHNAHPSDATVGLPTTLLPTSLPPFDAESTATAEPQHTRVLEWGSLWTTALLVASHAPASLQPIGRPSTLRSGPAGHSSVAQRFGHSATCCK